jgi:uncharacterized protein
MTLVETLGLTAAAAAGGAINAVAGGGTLITFPTLLFFGVEPVRANATSTLALVFGTFGGMYGYRRHIDPVRRWLWRFVPISLLGGLIGSVLLTLTSNKTFSHLVPFLILFATLLLLAQGFFRRLASSDARNSGDGASDRERSCPPAHLWESNPRPTASIYLAMGFQFLVALYGGYFGAGIGILMLATLGFIGLQNIYEMNTLKTILGSLINLMAAVWFVIAGLIDWPEAATMTVGALTGYYFGSHFSQRISQQRVRQLITAIGLALSAVTFYQEFVR